MSTCSIELAGKISSSIEEYFMIEAPDKSNFSLSELEQFVGAEQKIKKFKLANYINISDEIRRTTTELFNLYLLSDVSDYISDTSAQAVITKSNVVKDFSTNTIVDLFHTLPLAKAYFEGSINGKILKEILIGDPNSNTFVSSNAELTTNLNNLKNKLFRDIQEFLIKEGRITNKEVFDLYDERGNVADFSKYKAVMTTLGSYFFSGNDFNMIKSYSGKVIPNLTADLREETAVYDAYNAGILLSNFDSILNVYFNGLVDVNYNYFNNLTSNVGTNDKYSLKIEGIKTAYWKKDTHEAESSENSEDKLTKLLISIIPAYDKKGNKTTEFMETKDFYLFAAQLSNFELLYGNKLRNKEVTGEAKKDQTSGFDYFNKNSSKQLMWYINEITAAMEDRSGSIPELKTHFQANYNFIISLKNFLESSEYNIQTKEANSTGSVINMLTQVINNNFGASYYKYNANGKYVLQEMYKQDFNNIQVQNTTLATLFNNSAKSKFYDLTSTNEKNKFDRLFNNLSDSQLISGISNTEKREIAKYIKEKVGISLHYLAFNDVIRDLESQPAQKGERITVGTFKNQLRSLIGDANDDFGSSDFRDAIKESIITKATKGDVTAGDYIKKVLGNTLYIALRNSYLSNFIIKPVMNVETLSGEKLPTFKTATLTYKDTELFELQRSFQNENPTGQFKSLLIKDSAAIVGTGTKLEAINGQHNKEAVKFSVSENYVSDFQFDFLKGLVKNKTFSVMIGNYSDKNSILTKIISAEHKVNGQNVVTSSVDNILGIIRSQGRNYYLDTLTKVFSDYKLLFDTLGIANKIKLDKFDKGFEANVAEINRLLGIHNIRNLVEQYTNKSGDFSKLSLTEELHYSKYSGGKISLNQILLDNFRIFSDAKPDGLFFGKNGFVAQQEENLVKKFKQFNKSLPKGTGDLNFISTTKVAEIEEYVAALGLAKEDFAFIVGKDGKPTKERDYSTLVKNGKLNPLVRKWQWLNTLYRNEYLFISAKGEYMHPHKNNSSIRNINDPDFWEKYIRESSGRLVSMAKRNVIFTATIESPVRNSKLGVPDKINHATIDDYLIETFNYSGNVEKGLESHNGASYLEYTYSLMVDNSYPGKGYSGTKKQFGTLISPFGVTVKKDAENVITNDKIRLSHNSDLRWLNKKKQMLGLNTNDVSVDFTKEYQNRFYYNKLGTIYNIRKVEIKGDSYKIWTSKKVSDGWVNINKPAEGKFNTLYDLWDAFGGAYSTIQDGNWSEGSNELLYEVITTPDAEGNYPLKNKMIHVISNISGVKAGAVNVNKSSYWTNANKLAYTSFESRFMGPQLDASHEADESKIKEVTQVISALAQNGNTAHLAMEAYNDIANVIKKAAAPYLRYMEVGKDVKTDELYKYLSDKFIRAIENTKGDNIAKTLVQALSKDVRIPFSNQNFFVPFVRDVITRMNNEFITRYYTGTGAVLIPSHGIIQLYDIPVRNESGQVTGYRVATQSDLAKEALASFDAAKNPNVTSNDQIIEEYINRLLPPEAITWDKIQMGDTVLIDQEFTDYLTHADGVTIVETKEIRPVPITLSTPALYYQYKQYGKIPVFKVNSKPRDLKPSNITFEVNGETRNLFDLDSIKLRTKLGTTLSIQDEIILSQLAKKFNINPTDYKAIGNILNKWTQRNLQLLDEKIVMRPISEFTKNGIVDFDSYFGSDSLTDDIYSDVKEHYIQNNSAPVTNYKFYAAELVLGDIYQTRFSRDDVDSMYEITNKGPQYFADKLVNVFNDDETKADIKLNVSTSDTPVYIRYVDQLPGVDKTINLKLESFAGENGVTENRYVRYNQRGDVMYTLPDIENIRVVKENGQEIILMKAATKVIVDNKEVWNRIDNFNNNLSDLIKSFNGTIKSLVPLMSGPLNKALIARRINKQTKKEEDYEILLSKVTMYEFSRFSGYHQTNDNYLNEKWLRENKDSIIKQLSTKMFASWQKSHEFVSARIPSQSMQSFMEMKNVAYFNTKSNDAYVSVWQIWLQGSDFDIDKAYLLGSGFRHNGQFDLWTNISGYSTVDQLTALEKLPIPTGITAVEGAGGIDLTEEFEEFSNSLVGQNIINELSVSSIKVLNKALRKFNAYTNTLEKVEGEKISKYKNVYINDSTATESKKIFLNLLNSHNTFAGHLKARDAVKNSVVSRIKGIISAPSNQIIANIPVDVKMWHNAADAAIERSGREAIQLSPYDIFSFYKQQRDAAVGKDDVGIAANGLKVTFALSSYYNDFYKNKLSITDLTPENLARIRQDYTSFRKEFTFSGTSGLQVFNLSTISDVQISKNQQQLIREALGDFKALKSDSALSLSAFTSAATDNAKELIMAKVNASTELASMHVYLLTLGFTPDQVAEIMTDSVVEDIIEKLETNIFFDANIPRVNIIMGTLAKEYKASGLKETDAKVINLKMLKEIYQGAQEMRVLSSIFAVNQKVPANTEEMNKFLNNFEQAVYTREHLIFNNALGKLNEISTLEQSSSIENRTTKAEEAWEIILEEIFKNNKQLDSVKDRIHVQDIIRRASKISVNYTKEDGTRATKVVSLVGGKFDFRYYVDKDNVPYRKATKEYYNLLKNTVNVFDVIENVPHFKEMVDGLVLSHNMLINSSMKYNAVFSILKDVVRENSHRIVFLQSDEKNEHIKNQMGNYSLPVLIGETEVNKTLLGIDIMMKEKWLKESSTGNLTFNVKELMKLANVSEIWLYTSDNARTSVPNTNSSDAVLVKIDDNTNPIVTLNTNYGIANFKKICEELLLPILQEKGGSVLTDYLKVESRNNIFGIRGNIITSTFSLSDLNNPVSIEKFQKLVIAFNNLDVKSSVQGVLKSNEGTALKWRDILYVYNLLVSNERYGNKSLTPLFQDYMKETDSLGYSYITFSSKLDSRTLKLFDPIERLKDNLEYLDADPKRQAELLEITKKELANDLLFYAFNKYGLLYTKDKKDTELLVSNPDFVVVTSLTESVETKRKWKEFNDLMRLIKSGGYIIKFKC